MVRWALAGRGRLCNCFGTDNADGASNVTTRPTSARLNTSIPYVT
jgi:hypothetical protein